MWVKKKKLFRGKTYSTIYLFDMSMSLFLNENQHISCCVNNQSDFDTFEIQIYSQI